MRVIDLLKELNIAFETLRIYEESINFSFKDINQLIPLDLYNEILKTHNERKADTNHKKITSFKQNETYRLNAKVKWYFNNQTNGEYGFLEIKGLPDIHFSGKVYLYSNPKDLKPGHEVVVTLAKEDVVSKNQNLKALSVNSLSEEKDISYLLFHLLYNFHHFKSQTIENLLNQISSLSLQISDKNKTEIKAFIDQKIKIETLEIEKLSHITKLLKVCNIDLGSFKSYFPKISSEKIFGLWIENTDLEINFDLLKQPLIDYLKSKFLVDKQLL